MTLFPAQSYNTDIVGPLPESANGNHCVLIVVDRFSSRIFLYAHSKHCTAPEMAQLFVDEICYTARRGLLLSVISDNDKLFSPQVSSKLCLNDSVPSGISPQHALSLRTDKRSVT